VQETMGIRVRWLLVLGLLAGMVLSWPLWIPFGRLGFPMVPLFAWIGQMPVLLTLISIAIGISGVFLLLFPAQKGPFLWMTALLIVGFVVDVNTAQPWVWFYCLILIAFYFSAFSNDPVPFAGLQIVLLGVYGWGGIYKITPYFAVDNLPWFFSAFSWLAPLGKLPALGYALAIGEACFVLGLCWHRTRQFTRVVVVLFHLSICLILSPLGLNWNLVVLPWNLAMAGMVWVLFDSKRPFILPKQPLFRIFIGVVCLGPALNLIGAWPDAFSWKLYSNTQSEATFYNPKGTVPCADLQAVWTKMAFNEQQYLLLDDWSNDALKAPLHSSKQVFWALGRHLCQCEGISDSAGLYLLQVSPWNRAAERMDFYPCALLKAQAH
jgi:hypothetical protein